MLAIVINLLQFSFVALTSIFFLVDPIAAVPTFLSITAHADAQQRRHMAWRAAVTCFVVLSSFTIAGTLIFKLFGITLAAFKIAGGLILLLIGMDMLQPAAPQRKKLPRKLRKARIKKTLESFRWAYRCSLAPAQSPPSWC